jgi:hypothetical protein
MTIVLKKEININTLVDGTTEELRTGWTTRSGRLTGLLRSIFGWMVSHLGMETAE